MNKLQLFVYKLKTKNYLLTVLIFLNLQNHPTFHSEERLVYLVNRRECSAGLHVSILCFKRKKGANFVSQPVHVYWLIDCPSATTWRSGSTFLGDLLNHYPGTFYYFEPLHWTHALGDFATTVDMWVWVREVRVCTRVINK